MRARLTRLAHHAPLTVSDVILADSPLAYYRFSEAASSATAADSSGNARTLTLNGPHTTGIAGKNSRVGSCVAFLTTGYGSVADSSAFRLTGDLTFETWVRLSAALANNTEQPLASLGGSGETEAMNYLYHFALEVAATIPRFRFIHENGAGVNNDASQNITYTPTAWNHFAVTRDTAAKVHEVYVNGISVGTQGFANNPTGGTTSIFELNRNAGTSANGNKNTEYDEWALFNSKLSAARIFEHYRAGRR